jgi:multicomponent Na+:H+ antiporter subunit F
MSDGYHLIAFLLLGSIVLGLVRIVRGPTPADRILAVQLSGTGAAAIVLTLSYAQGTDRLIDVALVVALLAAAVQIAFVKIHGSIPVSGRGEEDE